MGRLPQCRLRLCYTLSNMMMMMMMIDDDEKNDDDDDDVHCCYDDHDDHVQADGDAVVNVFLW